MNLSNHDEERRDFDNRYVIHVVASGPGDHTVRPCRPSLRAWAEAEREKLVKHGKLKLPQPPQPDEPK